MRERAGERLGDELTRGRGAALRRARCTTSASRSPAACARRPHHVHRPRRGRRADGARPVPAPAHQRALRALPRGLTRHHLVLGFLVHERPLDRAQVYRYLRRTAPVEVEVTLLSCADRLATRGRSADEATAAHLDLARELMGAALDWREHGPPRVPVRGDELAARARDRARSGAGPTPRRAGAGGLRGRCGHSRRRPSRWRVGCARDRRLRGLPGRAPARRRRRRARGDGGVPPARCLHLDRPVRAHRGGVRVDPQRVRSASAGRGGRHPRPPAAQARGLRRHGLHRPQDRALCGPDRGHQARRDPRLPRPRLHHHGAPRRGERAGRSAQPARGAARSCCSTARCACSTPSSTGWSTTTRPRIAGLGEDIDQVEDQVFSGSRSNAAERIYKLKREVLQFGHAVGPLVEPVDRLARGKYDVIHPEVRTYFRDVNDHLLRAHDQLEGYRDLLTSVLAGEPDPGRACARTRTCARSRRGWRSRRCRPRSPASTG